MGKKSIYYYIVAFLFCCAVSIPLILPYFHSGYFPTHDGEWAVVRLADMYREIRDFQFPPRYSGNLNVGYGYPLFNFAYPLPYYVGLLIHFIGFGFVDSIKLVFALTVPLSAFFMFLLGKTLWKNTLAGVFCMLLYIYMPYRLVDLYVRGSIGESIAFVFFPLLFIFYYKILTQKTTLLTPLIAGVVYALLILAHNIMAVLFSFLLVLFTFGFLFRQKITSFIHIFIFVIFGYLLAAYFWLPALVEKQYILLSRVPIANRNLYYVTLDKLLFSPWGYGVPTSTDGFTYQLGAIHILLLLLVIAVIIVSFLSHTVKKELAFFFVCISVVVFFILSFFLFKPSQFLWEYTPLLKEINYPWILIGILGFLISIIVGYLTKNKFLMSITLGGIVINILLITPYARPESYTNKGDDFYLTNDATTTSSKELMPLWVKSFPLVRPAEKVAVTKGEGSITNIVANSKKITFQADFTKKSTVVINTIYYPGWHIIANNNQVNERHDNEKGVMEITLPKGAYAVEASFTETPLRLFADILSLGSFVFFFVIVIKEIVQNKVAVKTAVKKLRF